MRRIIRLRSPGLPFSLTKIKEELDLLFSYRTVKIAIRLSLGLLALVFILSLILWTKLPPEMPLFYSRPWGEEQLVKKQWFLIPSLICFLLIVFNLRLASFCLKKENLLAKILIWTTVILAFLISTTTIRILLIVV